jgi:membrane fusion protein, macrolide-specific efflux system
MSEAGRASIASRLGRLPRLLGRHRWISAGVVVVVVAGGVITYYVTDSSSSPAASATTTYRLEAAALGTVRQAVSSTGTLEPADDDSVSFAVSGDVTSVQVSQGDSVKKNQVLATIDSASLKANLAQAEASLATANAKVSSDEDSSVSSDQLTADESAATAASGQVTSAKASLADATLRSPISGVIASTDISVGDTVSGSGSSGSSGGSGGSGGSGSGAGSDTGGDSGSGSSTAQFEVISTNSWIVNATVDATEVGLIKNGDQAQLTIDGATGTVYGLISSVGVIASDSSSGSAAYPVVIAVTGSPSGLHAGSTATVSLIYKQLVNVLTVPSLALHASNGKTVVWESANGKTTGSRVVKTVTTGLSSGGSTQITSGLSAGDEVLVEVITINRTGSSGTSSTTRGNFGGGFGGGGFGGGGFGGGGFGGGGFGGGTSVTGGGN